MNSDVTSQTPAPPRSSALRLTIRGLGHVPSFKNSRVLFLTNPRNRAWMKKAAASIESQLRSAYRIDDHAMETGASLLCWIATRMPLDDSLDWIGVPCGNWRRVRKGEEGADILIERLE
jgi:hypothetical protein